MTTKCDRLAIRPLGAEATEVTKECIAMTDAIKNDSRRDYRLDVNVDTYIECYHAQGDKTPRHWDSARGVYVSDDGEMEGVLNVLTLAAPEAYSRAITLRSIWHHLGETTRAYILRDIDYENSAYGVNLDPTDQLAIDADCDGYAED
jgi:hypothetical protein